MIVLELKNITLMTEVMERFLGEEGRGNEDMGT